MLGCLSLGDDLFGNIECRRSLVNVDARLSLSWHSSFVLVLVLIWRVSSLGDDLFGNVECRCSIMNVDARL